MQVLKVEPGKIPMSIEIEDTLEELQKEVGGYIEAIYPFEEPVCLICNEEGKLCGMKANRSLKDEDGEVYDIVFGSFLITGVSEDRFDSLNKEQLEKYEKMFHYPETFFRIGNRILALPETEIQEEGSARDVSNVR